MTAGAPTESPLVARLERLIFGHRALILLADCQRALNPPIKVLVN